LSFANLDDVGGNFQVINGIDTDGDGISDHIDLDSDNDGISDLVESGLNASEVDTDNDGMLDGATDIDSDGLLEVAGATSPTDSDDTGSNATTDGQRRQ